MKKIVFVLMMSLSGLALASPALATNSNSHWNENDGCDHGNSHKPCRPDPQPTHGKDCETHGNHGGINEDHCSGDSTTTTQPPVTTTTTSKPSKNPEPPLPPLLIVGPTGPQGPEGPPGIQGPPGPVQVVVVDNPGTVTVKVKPPVALPRTA
jgi:hypothetical protein